MATSEIELDSPAIRALGTRFKVTEVFLRDDGCASDNRQASSLPKHIRFKYDSDEDNVDGNNGEISLNACPDTWEDSIVMEDDDLIQQMSALGLPFCFQTSKQQRSGKTKKKSKATQPKNWQIQGRSEDQVSESCRMSKEGLSQADFPDKSCNSSSLSLPDQTEVSCSGFDASDEITRCTTNSYVEHKPAYLASQITDLQTETGLLSVGVSSNLCSDNACFISYMHDDALERHQKKMCMSLTEQVKLAGSELCVSEIQHEDLGSSYTNEQAQVADLSKESQDTVVHGNDDNAKCNSQDEDVKCNGTSGDWSAFWDSFYMRYYFYNAKTQESTWYPPPGMENFDFGGISCITSETNADMPGTNPNAPTPRCEEEKVDGHEMFEKTGPDERRVDIMHSPQELIDNDLSTSLTVLSDEPCVAGTGELPKTLNGSCQDELSLVTSLDTGQRTCSEDIETTANDLSMQDVPAAIKRKKTRKNRTRKKSSHDNGGHKIETAEEFYVDITKYWCQRYLLFSRFDSGVKMDEEGWFSVTPEAIARHQASRFGHGIIIDCFAGVGGNAIQFAKTGNHVIAIDIDPRKIDYACHNAAIYGVKDRIDFIVGDSLSIGPKLKADTIFLSPPWGGPDYSKLDSYDISMLQPYDGQFLFNTFKAIASMIIMFLPRNVNLVQLADLALSANCAWSLEVEKNYLNGKLKAVTAYFSKAS